LEKSKREVFDFMSQSFNIGKVIVFVSMVTGIHCFHSNSASADQRVCVMTDESQTVCGKLINKKEPIISVVSPNFQKDKKGHTFLLRNCIRTNNNLACTLAITTKKDDDTILVGQHSIIANTGKTYGHSSVSFNGSTYNGYGIQQMSPGIEYFVDLVFEDIPEQVTRASVLNVAIDQKIVQFRNISISDR
jgi:hypothetical protein